MPDLPPLSWAVAFTGVFLGGFVSGLAGFGTALFALGFLLYVLPPEPAVAVILLLSLVSISQGLWTIRHAIVPNAAHMLRFLIPALFGIPVGSMLLAYVSPTALKLFIGVVFLTYGAAFVLLAQKPRVVPDSLPVDAAVGFVGGVLGGMAGLAGAFATLWSSLKPWPKDKTRAILQPHNFAILALSALWLSRRGVFTGEVLAFSAACLPVLVAGTLTGLSLYRRLNDVAYKTALVRLLFVAGALILANEIRLWAG